jgi:hypothetical protein
VPIAAFILRIRGIVAGSKGWGPTAIDSREVRREDAGVAEPDIPYYRRDLALIHHLGFGFHADDCAPGILDLLQPVRERDGLVVELGCGSGLLTRYLIDAVTG